MWSKRKCSDGAYKQLIIDVVKRPIFKQIVSVKYHGSKNRSLNNNVKTDFMLCSLRGKPSSQCIIDT